jgi:LysR family glycine cleavage system transcriptional activator
MLTTHTLLHVIGYEDGWGYWLNQTGFHGIDPSQGMQFDTLITALEMAQLGHGLALGRTSLVARMIADGRLIAPFEQSVATSEAFYLTCPAQRFMSEQAAAFWSWLEGEAQSAREAELAKLCAGVSGDRSR